MGAAAKVVGVHLSKDLPVLFFAMGDDLTDSWSLAKKVVETIVLVIEDEGNEASARCNSAYLIQYLLKNSKLYWVNEAPNMIFIHIVLLSDTDSAIILRSIKSCWFNP